MTDEKTGLTADNIDGPLRNPNRSGYTSPTNIGGISSMIMWDLKSLFSICNKVVIVCDAIHSADPDLQNSPGRTNIRFCPIEASTTVLINVARPSNTLKSPALLSIPRYSATFGF